MTLRKSFSFLPSVVHYTAVYTNKELTEIERKSGT